MPRPLWEILTAPGGAQSVRWRWLLGSPGSPAEVASLAKLWVAQGEVSPVSTRVEIDPLVERTLTLFARVPVPPGWTGSPVQDDLGGLALLSAEGDLLALIWFPAQIKDDLRAVDIAVWAMGGPAYDA